MEFFKSLNLLQKRIIAGALGAAAGYAYYYYIGCMSGSCPITSNPYISTIYGALLGVLLVPSQKQSTEKNNGNDIPTNQEV